jgi:hypothetical protein
MSQSAVLSQGRHFHPESKGSKAVAARSRRQAARGDIQSWDKDRSLADIVAGENG